LQRLSVTTPGGVRQEGDAQEGDDAPQRAPEEEQEGEVEGVTSGFARMFAGTSSGAANRRLQDASAPAHPALAVPGAVSDNAALNNVLSSPSHVSFPSRPVPLNRCA